MKDWNIHDLMSGLSSKHPIFHGEADLQHALAWHIQTLDRNCRVRLEVRFQKISEERFGKNSFVDVWLPDRKIAVELKFAKDNFRTFNNGEEFELRKGAWDVAAYGFVKDIKRLEKLKDDGEICTGFAIFLSNEPNIWTRRNGPNQFDEFRLHEKQALFAGLHRVAGGATETIRKSHPPVELSRSYPVCWRPYSNLEGEGRGEFRYLAIKV